mgnify:CR=1 FL=1
MKNKEKFAKEIIEVACSGGVLAVSSGIIRKCAGLPCHECSFNINGIECNEMRKTWAESEYMEYEIDWSKVPVDTPVISSSGYRYYFAGYHEGNSFIDVFLQGRTSWSSENFTKNICKNTSELAREEDKIKYRKIKEG